MIYIYIIIYQLKGRGNAVTSSINKSLYTLWCLLENLTLDLRDSIYSLGNSGYIWIHQLWIGNASSYLFESAVCSKQEAHRKAHEAALPHEKEHCVPRGDRDGGCRDRRPYRVNTLHRVNILSRIWWERQM